MNDKLKKFNPAQLRKRRERIYRENVTDFVLMPTINGRTLTPIPACDRVDAFYKFVAKHFEPFVYITDEDKGFVESDYIQGVAIGTKTYQSLRKFAETDYGSSVIKEVLENQKKLGDFKVLSSVIKTASGADNQISIPEKFPSSEKFKISGQEIYDLAIIYHEFSHTYVFNASGKYTVDQEGERRAVRKFENPVRMRAGYEPRYAYSDRAGNNTVNVITGETKAGNWAVSKYDPRVMVAVDDPDRLHPNKNAKRRP